MSGGRKPGRDSIKGQGSKRLWPAHYISSRILPGVLATSVLSFSVNYLSLWQKIWSKRRVTQQGSVTLSMTSASLTGPSSLPSLWPRILLPQSPSRPPPQKCLPTPLTVEFSTSCATFSSLHTQIFPPFSLVIYLTILLAILDGKRMMQEVGWEKFPF